VHSANRPEATGHPLDGDELQVIARPRRPQSDPSIKPYGLDPAAPRASGPGEATARLLILARRAKLSRIVVAAVAACTAILVAAGVAHLARANNRDVAIATGSAARPTATALPTTTLSSPIPTPAQTPIPTSTPIPAEAPATGTLRVQRPAAAGLVWLDGSKLTTPTAIVSCGQHQLKVGARGRAHSINVPCGGELRVSR